jgi:hypothetical protein
MSLALIVALVAALAMWMRSRSRPIQVDDPPEWPPLPPLGDGGTPGGTDPGPVADGEPEAVARAATSDQVWRDGAHDGGCPDGFPIKAKDSSGIFHVPGGRFYDRTNPDRCYPDAESAIADGYRQSKT